MHTSSPQTALTALTWRRFLISSWPWRSVGFILATIPPAAAAFAVVGIPWLVLVARLSRGDLQPGPIVLLVLLGSALVAGLGPLIAVPLSYLERRRLSIVDTRPVDLGPRRPAPRGLAPWLRARYRDPDTWREVGYIWLLGTLIPVLSTAVLLTVPLAVVFVASPLLVRAQQPGGDPVALGFGQVATVGQTVPYVIGGVLLLALFPYLLALLAGAHAAVARALLGGTDTRLRAELVEVSRSRARLADMFEAERHRIQRDLHDGAQQKLVGLTMQLGLARLDLPPDAPAAASVIAAHEQAKQLMDELRALIHGIAPQILTELGLPAALDELAGRAAIPVAVEAHLPGRAVSMIESAAYFAVSEALTNIAKHSGASAAQVTARTQGDQLMIEIYDNGRGGADPRRGTGLTGIADRVAVTGGRMLLSSPPGGPTLLRVELPWTHNQTPSA